MKITILSFIILLLASMNTFAQKSLFRMYRYECSELFGVDLTKPKGFKVVDGVIPFRINEKRHIGSLYMTALESKTKDCLIFYPYFSIYELPDSLIKNMVYGEVKAALNLDPDDKTIELDSAKYIKMIAQDNMEDYSNADTVFIYKIPLSKPYKEIFNECVGINVIKTGHPSGMIKILLTEEGKKKEDEYLKILFNSMRYNNVAPEYNKEKADKIFKKMKYRFPFHRKKDKSQ